MMKFLVCFLALIGSATASNLRASAKLELVARLAHMTDVELGQAMKMGLREEIGQGGVFDQLNTLMTMCNYAMGQQSCDKTLQTAQTAAASEASNSVSSMVNGLAQRFGAPSGVASQMSTGLASSVQNVISNFNPGNTLKSLFGR